MDSGAAVAGSVGADDAQLAEDFAVGDLVQSSFVDPIKVFALALVEAGNLDVLEESRHDL